MHTVSFIDPEAVDDKSRNSWRHKLKHDAESVFWLILYWAMVVQPKKCPREKISMASWSNLNRDYIEREAFVTFGLHSTSQIHWTASIPFSTPPPHRSPCMIQSGAAFLYDTI